MAAPEETEEFMDRTLGKGLGEDNRKFRQGGVGVWVQLNAGEVQVVDPAFHARPLTHERPTRLPLPLTP